MIESIIAGIDNFLSNNQYYGIIFASGILILIVLFYLITKKVIKSVCGKIEAANFLDVKFNKWIFNKILKTPHFKTGIISVIKIIWLAVQFIIVYFYLFSLQYFIPFIFNPSVITIIKGIYLSVMTTYLLIRVIQKISEFKNQIIEYLKSLKGTIINTLKIGSTTIFTAKRLVLFLRYCVVALYFIAVVLLIYLYVLLITGYFEILKTWKNLLVELIKNPVTGLITSFINYLPSLLILIIIFIAGRFIMNLNKIIFTEIETGNITLPGFKVEWSKTTYKIIRFIIIFFLLIIGYPYLPASNSEAFKAISIFFGILFSLGSTSIIGNMISGIVLTYMLAYKKGDRVKVGETIGDVIETNLLVTRVKTIKNEVITVPNSLIISNHIINYSSNTIESPLILHTSFTLGYDVPWRKVHEILLSVAAKTEGVLKEPEAFVLQKSLNDYSVTYELNAYTDKPHQMVVIYSFLHQNIQDQFREAGIEILSPMYNAVRNGNRSTVPKE